VILHEFRKRQRFIAADRRDPVVPADAMVSLGFRRSGCTITGGFAASLFARGASGSGDGEEEGWRIRRAREGDEGSNG